MGRNAAEGSSDVRDGGVQVESHDNDGYRKGFLRGSKLKNKVEVQIHTFQTIQM